ncbi:hypothetical protein AMJ85_00455 [candidate division BRC1 bacterium SM23_51]|nr:MAG: hypothetical protein AMJ85_00455 [candidate division BRC1 bacterium SM23_51]
MTERQPDEGPAADQQPLQPEPHFARIVETLAVPALIWTGYLANPADKEAKPDLDLAKYQISLLEVLEQKTKGNLDKGEENFLADMLSTARLAYVRASARLAEHPPKQESQPAPSEEKEGQEKQSEKKD